MSSANENPTITTFLRTFTLIETLVLIGAGFGLFLFPNIVGPLWPWDIAPFNTRFLGAIYLGALIPVGYMYLSPRWSPTRPVLRAIFTFTSIVLVVSLFTLDKFDITSWPVWVWFAIYIGLPLSGGFHLWLYRSMPTNHLNSVLSNWSTILRITGVLFGLYGLGLLFLPHTFGNTFPWQLDVFHSQLYSAMFFTGSVMMYTVGKRSTSAEFIATGLTVATFTISAILGLYIVDADVQKIDWVSSTTLIWLTSLAALALLGLTMVLAGARKNFYQKDST